MDASDPVGQIVAKNLRRFRQGRGWTLSETAQMLAEQLGREQPLSDAGMSRWEDSTKPRRFSMTELYAICQVFGRPLARLFLPDLDEEIPTVDGQPFFAVWNACFEGTESASTDWQRVGFTQRRQLPLPGDEKKLLDGFSEEEVAEAVEMLHLLKEKSADTEESGGQS